jgi:hypothetical protein
MPQEVCIAASGQDRDPPGEEEQAYAIKKQQSYCLT